MIPSHGIYGEAKFKETESRVVVVRDREESNEELLFNAGVLSPWPTDSGSCPWPCRNKASSEASRASSVFAASHQHHRLRHYILMSTGSQCQKG